MELDRGTARRVGLVGLDVDGVLTDCAAYIGQAGAEAVELKRFDITDGVGIKLLQASGIKVVIVSGRHSEATAIRARELHIEEVVQDNGARKLPAFAAILEREGLGWEEAAFVGDDLPDIPVLRRVALPVAVDNAVPEVKALTPHVTRRRGGDGAVREFCEALLKARGAWDEAVDAYLRERGETELEATVR